MSASATCGCGFRVEGTVDEVIAAIRVHDEGCARAQDAARSRDEWRREHDLPEAVSGVLAEVRDERARQDAKHGDQSHLPDGTGPHVQPEFYPHRAENMAALAKRRTDRAAQDGRSTYEQILTEEYLEAIAEASPAKLRTELVQVAAVAVQWVEAIDRRGAVLSEGQEASR